MKGLTSALSRHARFYIALACGLAAWAGACAVGMDHPELAGGDVFYLVFLALCLALVAGQSKAELKRRARTEDEGMVVVMAIIIATMAFFCVAVFTALHRKQGGIDVAPLALAGIGAPLGWFVLHTAMAFHYADIHYFEDPDCEGGERDLDFPGRGDPGMWDFLYYSFVVGMTAQVSDVQVRTTAMRKLTLFHGVVSFFFNTVFIAMAVNAGVAMAT
ncbi:MAG TPA: DUF1345 domain-containing protein [Rhizomicrobium sp.]|nr:DUF1345 domain-containing protein [Rhizomicrobium sp.]